MRRRASSRLRTLLVASLIALQSALLLVSSYLLALLPVALAARRRATRGGPTAGDPIGFVVLVPAHNEAAGIGRTLDSLRDQTYASQHYRIVVIADHCADETASIGRAAGVEVLERTAGGATGKGAALAWAFDQVAREDRPPDAVVIVDADCVASSNFLDAAASRLRASRQVVQGAYYVTNPGDSPAAGLRHAAFSLVNFVRPLAKSHLGLSAGLLGTGMVFPWSVLTEVPWRAFSLTEDLEYHLMLLEAGERTGFAPEMSVSSPMPLTERDSASQQARWEAGREGAARAWSARLLRTGIKRRDPVLLHAGAELLMPPQTLHMAANLVLAVAALPLRSRRLLRLSALSIGAQTTFVLAGMAIAGAPREAYTALTRTPALMKDKAQIAMSLAGDRNERRWVPTPRAPSPDTSE